MPYCRAVISVRHCSKPGCSRPAVATLTYDYSDSTAVVGSLSAAADPNAYDLCEHHANSLTVPRGWQIVRLQTTFEPAPPSGDDLMALVDAVRQAAAHTRNRSERADAAETQTPAQPAAAPKTAARASAHAELGPFAQATSSHEAESSSPLDPNSPWARRRAQFKLITEEPSADQEQSDQE